MGRQLYIDAGRGFSCRGFLTALENLKGEQTEIQKEETGSFTLVQAEEKLNRAGLCPGLLKKGERALELLKNKEGTGGEELKALISCLSLLEELGVSRVFVSPLGEGSGDAEGNMFPEKEILELLSGGPFALRPLKHPGERLTLCGIALLLSLGEPWKEQESFQVERWSLGEDGEICLRCMILGKGQEQEEEGDVVRVLETNVDDCSGEQLGYAIERLMEAGALDASCFPVYMKKNRPAYMLQVICKEEIQERLEDVIFRETTSIGLRRYEERRRILPRSFREISLADGRKVRIKVCLHHGQEFFYPEYETIKKICRETGRSYKSVYQEAVKAAGGQR